MKSVQNNLCTRLCVRACRLLLPLVMLFAAGTLRAEVIYGPFVLQQDRYGTGVLPGWRVTSEPWPFCQQPFNFDPSDPMYTDLYSSPNPLPNAADHGLPVSEFLFLGPSLNFSGSDVLYRIASNAPTVPGDPEILGRLTFATTGTTPSANLSAFDDDLYLGANGGGMYLATNFSADYLLTAADFANESEQAILFYDPMNGGAGSPEGQFTGSSGYVGFRFLSDTSEQFYGWLHITDIDTSVSNSSGASTYGFNIDSFAIRSASVTEPAGIRIGSSNPGMFSSAVPEPGTYGVMLVVGAVCGLRAYRRRRSVTSSAA